MLSLLLAKANTVEARLKYYRYNAEIPMVEMSLNMMVAMGVIDQIPGRLVHDGNPYHTLATSRYRRSSRNPYAYPASARYSDRYDDYWDEPFGRYGDYWDEPFGRYSDYWDEPFGQFGDYWDEPRLHRRYSRSRYDYDPWYRNRARYRGWTDRWSNPWYSGWDGPRGSRYAYPRNSAWASPWGNSWNNPWLNPWTSPYGQLGGWPYTSAYSTVPLSPDVLLGNTWPGTTYPSDTPSKQYNNNNNNGQGSEQPSWFGRPSKVSYGRGEHRVENRKSYRRLNGLWIGNDGEMLGIRGNRFLWYDDRNQYAKGRLSRSPTMMKARVEGTNDVISYHYRLSGDELVIMSRDGKMRVFNRMPLLQPHRGAHKPRAAHSNYQPGTNATYFSHSSYHADAADSMSLSLPDQYRPDRVPAGRETHRESVLTPRYPKNAFPAANNLHVPDVLDNAVDGVSLKTNAGESGNADAASPAQTARDQDTAAPSAAVSQPVPAKQQAAASYSGNRYYSKPQGILPGADAAENDDVWKPLTPYSTYQAVDRAPGRTVPLYKAYGSAVMPAFKENADPIASSNGAGAGGNNLRSPSSGEAVNDPNTYLYSYMKESNTTRFSSSPASQGNSAHAGDAFATGNGSFVYTGPAGVMEDDGSNIWKPNNTLADRRRFRDHAPSYFSGGEPGQAAAAPKSNADVPKFTWSTRSWN